MFALLTVVLLTPAASAHTAAPAHVAATRLAPASVPNVNIVIKHGKAAFSSTVVHCKANDLCFTLTNLTNVRQQLVIQGLPSLILGPGVDQYFSFGLGVFSLSLKSNPQARLIVLAF